MVDLPFKTYKEAWDWGTYTLKNAEISDAEFDGAVMFEEAFGVRMPDFKYGDEFEKDCLKSEAEKFFLYVNRRTSHEPLQYIVGKWEFYGITFLVGKGVLIPRQDTETLVDVALKKFDGKKDISVIDLCAGSGCVGLALEKNLKLKKLTFVENSPEAANYLEKNIKRQASRGEILLADVRNEGTPAWCEKAHLIVANPPYLSSQDMERIPKEVACEPQAALFGGRDGLDFYQDITRLWKTRLEDSGVLAFEIGIGMEDDVSEILINHGFKNVRCYKDLNGIYRVVAGEKINLTTD